jgi:hypothetical protein
MLARGLVTPEQLRVRGAVIRARDIRGLRRVF